MLLLESANFRDIFIGIYSHEFLLMFTLPSYKITELQLAHMVAAPEVARVLISQASRTMYNDVINP